MLQPSERFKANITTNVSSVHIPVEIYDGGKIHYQAISKAQCNTVLTS